MALDIDHTWWLRCELGWAALDSRDGQHMLVRTDQKLNRSSCIEWKFGPAVTLEVHRIDDDKVREHVGGGLYIVRSACMLGACVFCGACQRV